MDTIVGDLLRIDEEARHLLAEAQDYYDQTIREIQKEKEQLRENYKEHAHSHIESVRQTEELAAAEQISAIEKRYALLAAKLEETYDRDHAAWEDTLFARCVEGVE